MMKKKIEAGPEHPNSKAKDMIEITICQEIQKSRQRNHSNELTLQKLTHMFQFAVVFHIHLVTLSQLKAK